jgi:predicted dehydrogenase
MGCRIVQAGLGNRGTQWAEIVAAHPEARHAAVVDPDPARVARFHARWPGVPAFARLEEALAAAVGADAVLLATPPDKHLAQCRAAFAAALPVLSEKPLSLDPAEANEIVRLADAHRTPLSVGLNFRYLAVTLAKRRLLAEGAFGPPGFAQMTYQRNRDGRAPRLNKYPLTMRYPMMLEQTVHHLDLLRFVYGREVETVLCRSWNPPWSMYAHDSNVACHLTMAGGLEVSYLGTWTGGWDRLEFLWRTDCAGGVVVQRALFGDLACARREADEPEPVALEPCEPFRDDTRALLDAFVAALRDGGPVPCDGRDHLRTLAACFAAIESAESRRAVDVAAWAAAHMPEAAFTRAPA